MISKDCSVRFVMQIRVVLFLVQERGTPLQRQIYALFLGRKGEGREFFLSAVFSSHNPHAKEAYFGVAYCEPLQ